MFSWLSFIRDQDIIEHQFRNQTGLGPPCPHRKSIRGPNPAQWPLGCFRNRSRRIRKGQRHKALEHTPQTDRWFLQGLCNLSSNCGFVDEDSPDQACMLLWGDAIFFFFFQIDPCWILRGLLTKLKLYMNYLILSP